MNYPLLTICTDCLTFISLFFSAIYDIKTQKIPNLFTLPFIQAGLILCLFRSWPKVTFSVFIVRFIILIFLFLISDKLNSKGAIKYPNSNSAEKSFPSGNYYPVSQEQLKQIRQDFGLGDLKMIMMMISLQGIYITFAIIILSAILMIITRLLINRKETMATLNQLIINIKYCPYNVTNNLTGQTFAYAPYFAVAWLIVIFYIRLKEIVC